MAFNVTLVLADYFQVLGEMPWLSESDIVGIPPVRIHIHRSTPSSSLCPPARHEETFTIWLSIKRLQGCVSISLMPPPVNASILDTGHTMA